GAEVCTCARRKGTKHDVRTAEAVGELPIYDRLQAPPHKVPCNRITNSFRDDEPESGWLALRDMQSRVGDAVRTSHAASRSHDTSVVIAPGHPVLPGRHVQNSRA